MLVNKEISWLYFNERVLQEAENAENPLRERIHFMGIYSNNMDEFFRVRVATLKRLESLGKQGSIILGADPKKILKEIQTIVLQQRDRFNKLFHSILKELETENIFLVNETQLDEEQSAFVYQYFIEQVRPKLIPIMLGFSNKFPVLKDDAIYLAVKLHLKSNKTQFALIKIPADSIPRFLLLPKKCLKNSIILLDDIIRFGLKDIFYIYDYNTISAHVIKLTKDAELDISDDIVESYVKKVSMSIKKRISGVPVRFVYDREIPQDLLDYLIKKLKFSKDAAIISGGRYHNFKDFMDFPKIGRKELKFEKLPPIPHKDIIHHSGILTAIKRKDILLHFPYHGFYNFIDLLREAAIDPDVKEIKITLYRLAKNSSVINALINAANNGKNVTAIVEIQARFDEEANIYWSNKLIEQGVKVIYGVNNLKVHSKLCLITRQEGKNIVNFSCVGTGNFNEVSATVFSDVFLLTADNRITKEVVKVFDFFNKNYKDDHFRHLLVAPFYMRKKILKLIIEETKIAKSGKYAAIWLKLNNLVDDEVIQALYEAAANGVKVFLNVRGMFLVNPDLPELKGNLKAMAILDRFLEHARIFIFHNNGKNLYFISSADLMKRNMDYRVEVACPVYDPEIQKQLKYFMDLQWLDNTKARVLGGNFSNRINILGEQKVNAQLDFYHFLNNQ